MAGGRPSLAGQFVPLEFDTNIVRISADSLAL
jgi:hypothetical protein